MFDFVRKHTKIMMLFMFLLIIPAFALVGVDGYRRMSAEGAAVAKVASYSITQSQWEAAHKGEVDRMRASVPNLDAKVIESPEARYMTLERMVRERVMEEAMKDSLLNVSDARLATALQQNPSIAALRKPDGSLDLDRYRQLAASQGLTPEGLEERVRHDMSVRQVETGLSASAFAPKGVADVALNAFFQRRNVQIAQFKPADFAGKIALTDADVSAFYDGNSALFQAPESLDVEYLVLDLDAVKKTISVADADLRSYYEQNVARLQAKEERRASHILINAPKDMPPAQRQKAKEQAQDLLLKVLEKPDTFAKVAAKFSQDPGSAAKGGDLDFFARGAMVKPFEDAAFAMRKGEISKLVESDFGYHIIELTDIKTPPKPTFESLRAGLETELKTQQAQRKFAEIAEIFSNGVYEQADSLKPMAERLKLELKTATALPRKAATGPLANPKLLAALFSPDAIERKHNTEAVETGPNQLVAARVVVHHPARTLPLADVRAAVKERLVAIRSQELAKKEGQASLTAWKAHGDQAKFPVAVEVSRQKGQSVTGPLLDALMRADTNALPAWVGLDLGAQGYAVARVNAVLPRTDPDAAAAAQERAQLAQWLSSAELLAYYEVLKERFKVQIKVPRPIAGAGLALNEQ
ncbi:MAG: SurA N-terminal domain-containing protein [Betaproteobacteria bacterium]